MPGADLLQWKCTYSGHYLFIGFPCYQFRVYKYARIWQPLNKFNYDSGFAQDM